MAAKTGLNLRSTYYILVVMPVAKPRVNQDTWKLGDEMMMVLLL